MVKVVNRLFVASLVVVSVLCGSHAVSQHMDTNKNTYMTTYTVECAPTKSGATLQHKTFEKIDSQGVKSNDSFSSFVKGINHGSSTAEKGPVVFNK